MSLPSLVPSIRSFYIAAGLAVPCEDRIFFYWEVEGKQIAKEDLGGNLKPTNQADIPHPRGRDSTNCMGDHTPGLWRLVNFLPFVRTVTSPSCRYWLLNVNRMNWVNSAI